MKSLVITEHSGFTISHYYSIPNRDYRVDDLGVEVCGPKFHDVNTQIYAFTVTPKDIPDVFTIEKIDYGGDIGDNFTIRIGEISANEYVLNFESSIIAMQYYLKLGKLRYQDQEDILKEHPEYEI